MQIDNQPEEQRREMFDHFFPSGRMLRTFKVRWVPLNSDSWSTDLVEVMEKEAKELSPAVGARRVISTEKRGGIETVLSIRDTWRDGERESLPDIGLIERIKHCRMAWRGFVVLDPRWRGRARSKLENVSKEYMEQCFLLSSLAPQSSPIGLNTLDALSRSSRIPPLKTIYNTVERGSSQKTCDTIKLNEPSLRFSSHPNFSHKERTCLSIVCDLTLVLLWQLELEGTIIFCFNSCQFSCSTIFFTR